MNLLHIFDRAHARRDYVTNVSKQLGNIATHIALILLANKYHRHQENIQYWVHTIRTYATPLLKQTIHGDDSPSARARAIEQAIHEEHDLDADWLYSQASDIFDDENFPSSRALCKVLAPVVRNIIHDRLLPVLRDKDPQNLKLFVNSLYCIEL